VVRKFKPFVDIITKTAPSPQLLADSLFWSGTENNRPAQPAGRRGGDTMAGGHGDGLLVKCQGLVVFTSFIFQSTKMRSTFSIKIKMVTLLLGNSARYYDL
jgi:hypothetical protein